MLSSSTLLSVATLVALTNAHAVILNVQGIEGSPASVGFQVDPSIARNCTTISPCQQDATLIRDVEIKQNIVNECGRTELSGNIDIGENTENALAAGAVTKVQGGTQMKVTIHQVNADGAGPFFCDLEETGNTGFFTQNLTVENNVPGANGLSQGKAQDFTMTVTMPANFTCQGASTGDICTVRCRNAAVAGPFGGCFPVQQIDGTPKANTPQNIQTIQSLNAVLGQVQQNQQDLGVAVAANQAAGSDQGLKNVAAVSSILGQSIVSKPAPTQTPKVQLPGEAGAAASTSASSAAPAKQTGGAKAGKGNGNGNAAGNAGNSTSNANNGNAASKGGNNADAKAGAKAGGAKAGATPSVAAGAASAKASAKGNAQSADETEETAAEAAKKRSLRWAKRFSQGVDSDES